MIKGFVAIWIVWVVIILSLVGGGIYVGLHFLSKVW